MYLQSRQSLFMQVYNLVLIYKVMG